jgi:curved DNA-binding protein CbpA
VTLYDTLGVSPDATPDEIQKAFRRQSMKHHPDQGGDPESFKEVRDAKEILTNPDKRAHYDRTGEVDSAPPTMDRNEAELRALIGNLLSQGSTDLIGDAKSHVGKVMSSLRQQLNAEKLAIKKANRHLLTLQRMNPDASAESGAGITIETLEGFIKSANHDIRNCEIELEMEEEKLRLLDEIKYEAERVEIDLSGTLYGRNVYAQFGEGGWSTFGGTP